MKLKDLQNKDFQVDDFFVLKDTEDIFLAIHCIKKDGRVIVLNAALKEWLNVDLIEINFV